VREQEKRPDEKTGRHSATPEPVAQAGVSGLGPTTPAAVLALQRSAGNRVVSRMLDEERHAHDATSQRELVDSALDSPGRAIDTATRTRLEGFHQTDLSDVRVHTGPLAQRSAAAIGARAYTIGKDIVIGAGADDAETLGHETRHVKQQTAGAVAGTDNGSGLRISDPAHHEEREAAADGAAFRSGAEHAPSVVAQRSDERDGEEPVTGAHAVQRVDGEDTTDEEDEQEEQDESQDTKGKGKAATTKAGLLGEVRDVVDEFTHAHGGGRHGRVTKSDVRLRFPRDKAQERTEQSLSHLSMLLHDALRRLQDDLVAATDGAETVNDREIQGMLINDRLLFASNFNETIDLLSNRFDDQLVSLRELLRQHQSDENRERGLFPADANEYAGRLNRADAKINAAFEGLRGVGDDATADAMRRAANRPVMITDAADPNMRALLTAEEYAGRVIMLRFGETNRRTRAGEVKPASMHAEQKLLMAIRKAGLKPQQATKPLAIMGKYRPCLGCAAALRYYRDVEGFGNLRFNPNYGHFYQDSVGSLASHMREMVADPRYLGYIREMLDPRQGGAVSTPALSGQAPPAGAVDNNGFEIRIPPQDARGRGYVTPSDSEAETGQQDGTKQYRGRKRKLNPYSAAAGGRRLGKGQQKVNTGRPAVRVLTDEQRTELRQLRQTEGNSDRLVTLLRHYALRRGSGEIPVSSTELDEAMGGGRNAAYRLITGRTGHEARDDRGPNPNLKRRTQQRGTDGAPSKKPRGMGKFKKGGILGDQGRQEIRDAIGLFPTFERDWRAARENPAAPRVTPSAMPHVLAETIAGLRRRYTVRELADELGMKESTLKHYLNKKFQSVNAKPEQGAPDEDVSMADAAMPEIKEEDLLAWEADNEMDDPEMDLLSPPAPEMPGYQRRYDLGSGQYYYVSDDNGWHYYLADGQLHMVPGGLMLDEDENENAPGTSSGARQQGAQAAAGGEAMDVDDAPAQSPAGRAVNEEEEEEVPYVGKGKAKARDRR